MAMDKVAEDVAAYSKMWMDLTTRVMTAGMSFNPSTPSLDNSEQLRKAVLGAVSEYFDNLMRSPQFLDMMKQSMDNAMAFRQQMNQSMTAVRHDTQGSAKEDTDSLMVTMRHMGSRLFDKLSQLESRLDAISRRLDSLPTNGEAEPADGTEVNPGVNSDANPPRRKTPPGRKARGDTAVNTGDANDGK